MALLTEEESNFSVKVRERSEVENEIGGRQAEIRDILFSECRLMFNQPNN